MKLVVSISRSRLQVFLGCVCVFGVLLATACRCPADTLLLKDGRSFEGKLLGRDTKTVTFEIHSFGIKAPRTFKTENVAIITEGEPKTQTKKPAASRPADTKTQKQYSGETYFVIPIEGTFGVQITNSVFTKCLNLARGANPTVVILDINSGGGALAELVDMLETLKKFQDLRTVAYVRQASSAAAFLAMSCKEVVLAPTGSIGGCVVFRLGPDGTPQNIEEKFSSIYRARFRSMATDAGHDPLLIEGMMRDDIVLSLIEGEGATKVVEDGSGKILKKQGKILTLTAKEAVACGLALGVADTVDASGELLGMKQWRQLPPSAIKIHHAWKRQVDKVVREYDSAIEQARGFYDDAVAASHAIKVARSMGEVRQRVSECIKYLDRSEQKLARASALAGKYPGLVRGGMIGHSTNEIEERRAQISGIRKILEVYR